MLCSLAVRKSSLLRASRRGGPPRPTSFAVRKSSSSTKKISSLGVLCALAVRKSSLPRTSRRGGPPRPTSSLVPTCGSGIPWGTGIPARVLPKGQTRHSLRFTASSFGWKVTAKSSTVKTAPVCSATAAKALAKGIFSNFRFIRPNS